MNYSIKKTYSEQVVEFVKLRLLSRDLLPGDPVNEAEIATTLGISRAPVREALHLLSKEGLVVSRPQKQKRIPALTSKEIRNSYFTGGVLEAAAVASKLEEYTDADIAAMEDILVKMKIIADADGNPEDLAPLDDEFHRILLSRVDNDLLVELCRRSCQGISKFLLYRDWISAYTPKEIHNRHKKIVETIKKRNAGEVEQSIREHYFTTGERMAKFGADE